MAEIVGSSTSSTNTPILTDENKEETGPAAKKVFTLKFEYRNEHVLTAEFLGHKHTLYNVVETLFKHVLAKQLNGKRLSTHLWRIAPMKGKISALQLNGVLSSKLCAVSWLSEEYHIFSSFNQQENLEMYGKPFPPEKVNPNKYWYLKKEDKLKFAYNACSPSVITIVNIQEIDNEAELDEGAYPKVKKETSTAMDYIRKFDDAFQAESLEFRQKKENANETVYSRRQERVIPAPASNWSSAEEEALIMLQYAGYKFTVSWNRFLQYTLLSRSKGTASGKWYALQNQVKELDSYHGESKWLYDGNGKSVEYCTKRALALLLSVRAEVIATPFQKARWNSYEEYREYVSGSDFFYGL